jgi:uncharacterized membrane protein
MELWITFALLSAILLAAWVLMLRRDVKHEMNTQVISFMYFPALILIPLLAKLTGESLNHAVAWDNWSLLLIMNVAVAISLFANTLALKKLPLTVVGPLRNLSPFFVAILSLLLLSQKLSSLNIVGLFVIVAGVVFLDLDIRHPRNISVFLSHLKNPATFLLLIAAISVSFGPVIASILLEKMNAFTLIYYSAIIMSILYWSLHYVKERQLPNKGLSVHEILWLLITGITVMLSDVFYFFALAFPGVLVAVVFGVRRLSNLFVTIFGGAVLHEKNGVYKAVMCAVMVAGTVLLVL